MLRSVAVADIKRGVGFRPTQDTTIIAKLQEAQRQLELGGTLPDFLLSFDNEITVTADDPEITLPTRFLRMHDDYEMYYLNDYDKKVFIPRRRYDEAYAAYVGSGEATDAGDVTENLTEGRPQVWVQRNKTTGILIPTPTVSFTMYLTCYVGAEVLETDIENAWLANQPDILIGLAGSWVAGILRDKDALSVFTQRYTMAQRRLIGDKVEDELGGRALVMGRDS